MSVLKLLRKANLRRQKEWVGDRQKAPASFAFMELAGEVGEACNAGKKLARFEMGWPGGVDTRDNLTEELADVIICVDLVALIYNIDLEKAVISKFNKTSDKLNFKTRLCPAAIVKKKASATGGNSRSSATGQGSSSTKRATGRSPGTTGQSLLKKKQVTGSKKKRSA